MFPPARESARRLGLVMLHQMIAALAAAFDDPHAPATQRVIDVPGIRDAAGTGG